MRSPEEIAYRVSYNDWFLREITEKGEVLYESGSVFKKILERKYRGMNPLTLEWIQKAEGDYAAIRLHQREESPNLDMLCFHAQQCIEKYLKAWLQENDVPFTKMRDLEKLLALIVPTIPDWHVWQSEFSVFSEDAIDFLYPGKYATADESEKAIDLCTEIRQAIRMELKLSES